MMVIILHLPNHPLSLFGLNEVVFLGKVIVGTSYQEIYNLHQTQRKKRCKKRCKKRNKLTQLNHLNQMNV